MIKISGLSKKYGSIEVLNSVSLELLRGNIYGVAGENGAGKTTLFRCIAGLESHSGEIRSDLKPLKNHLGFLISEPYFMPKITGEEYLRLLCNARGKEMNFSAEKNIFDLPLKQYASTYSTGMKKKLALTGILLQENEYFILDEPFNGIDIQSNIVLVEIIKKLKELDKIVLISSHIFSSLSENCDQIYLLKKREPLKAFQKTEFENLEEEMIKTVVGDRIDKLDLK
jgi:ABC-2 type transport system ATP-binding protein